VIHVALLVVTANCFFGHRGLVLPCCKREKYKGIIVGLYLICSLEWRQVTGCIFATEACVLKRGFVPIAGSPIEDAHLREEVGI
jgi:hypothetical protein